MRFLPHLLKRFVVNGRLVVIDHDGARHNFGTGENGPEVTIRFTDARIADEIVRNPELRAAEAYMDGRLVFENGGRAYDLLYLFSINRRTLAAHPVQQILARVWKLLKSLHQNNALGRAAKQAQAHYDHPEAFYALWLDPTMAYSCAYFMPKTYLGIN